MIHLLLPKPAEHLYYRFYTSVWSCTQMYSIAFPTWMFWKKKQAFHYPMQWPRKPSAASNTWPSTWMLQFWCSLSGGGTGWWWVLSEKKSVLAFLSIEERASFVKYVHFLLSAWMKCLDSLTAHVSTPQGSFSSPAWLLAFDHNLFISSGPHPIWKMMAAEGRTSPRTHK